MCYGLLSRKSTRLGYSQRRWKIAKKPKLVYVKRNNFFIKPNYVMKQKEDKKLRGNDKAFKNDYSTERNPKITSCRFFFPCFANCLIELKIKIP